MALGEGSTGNPQAIFALALALLPPAALAAVVAADLRAVPAVPFLTAALAVEGAALALGIWGIRRSARRAARRLWAGIAGLVLGAVGTALFALGLWATLVEG